MKPRSILSKSSTLHISGAGPAGLTAAITCAQAGYKTIVHEQKKSVGARFHGDFQGLENWTSPEDIFENFASMGIKPNFPRTEFNHFMIFDPNGDAYPVHSEQPLFYLVRRGIGENTLDTVLFHQARELGVEIQFGDKVRQLPEGGICAEGPRIGDIIAAGYQFETDLPDAVYAVLSDKMAPKGYGYLLIHQGRATLASCLFADFHNEREYLDNTADFFQQKLQFSMHNPKRFGGLGNVSYPTSARKGNILYIGEAAGFQDALWGFGIRYAMTSGQLAAQAWLMGKPEDYDRLWQQALGAQMRAGLVNRWMYSKLGNKGYTRFLKRMTSHNDVRAWLCKHYHEQWYTKLLFPWVNHSLPSKRKEYRCADPDCSCTWCHCKRHHHDTFGTV